VAWAIPRAPSRQNARLEITNFDCSVGGRGGQKEPQVQDRGTFPKSINKGGGKLEARQRERRLFLGRISPSGRPSHSGAGERLAQLFAGMERYVALDRKLI